MKHKRANINRRKYASTVNLWAKIHNAHVEAEERRVRRLREFKRPAAAVLKANRMRYAQNERERKNAKRALLIRHSIALNPCNSAAWA